MGGSSRCINSGGVLGGECVVHSSVYEAVIVRGLTRTGLGATLSYLQSQAGELDTQRGSPESRGGHGHIIDGVVSLR